ncbi:hypothetical protein EVAR_69642_1 [Eumeta japonica]|uniref:Uncharacterized protein n=1 Tax=Eumeta variegata TaxID=151549 RepID=A0A4C1SVV6_EUMVA|nr:hypothetical protein EVAR_69642_1 [Eumeta japonica]
MSAQTVKTGRFVLPHGVGLAYMRITALKISRLRSTLTFSMPISAAVVVLDRWVSVYLNRQSIVTKKHPLRQHLSIKGIEGEGNAVPSNPLHAAIDNVFDIDQLQDFPIRHRVEHTASRSFDPLAMNEKWAYVITIILQTPYTFS